jgi:hypothetical protein
MLEDSLPTLVLLREIVLIGWALLSVVLFAPEPMMLLQSMNARWKRILTMLFVVVPMSMVIAAVMLPYFFVLTFLPLLQFVEQHFKPGIWPLIAILIITLVIAGKNLADTLERQELVANFIFRWVGRHAFGVGICPNRTCINFRIAVRIAVTVHLIASLARAARLSALSPKFDPKLANAWWSCGNRERD